MYHLVLTFLVFLKRIFYWRSYFGFKKKNYYKPFHDHPGLARDLNESFPRFVWVASRFNIDRSRNVLTTDRPKICQRLKQLFDTVISTKIAAKTRISQEKCLTVHDVITPFIVVICCQIFWVYGGRLSSSFSSSTAPWNRKCPLTFYETPPWVGYRSTF